MPVFSTSALPMCTFNGHFYPFKLKIKRYLSTAWKNKNDTCTMYLKKIHCTIYLKKIPLHCIAWQNQE